MYLISLMSVICGIVIVIVDSQTTLISTASWTGDPSPTVSDAYQASKAFDADPNSCAATGPSTALQAAALTIDMKSIQNINKMVVTSRADALVSWTTGLTDMDSVKVYVSTDNPPITKQECKFEPATSTTAFSTATNGKVTFNCLTASSTGSSGRYIILSQPFKTGVAVYVCDLNVYGIDPPVTAVPSPVLATTISAATSSGKTSEQSTTTTKSAYSAVSSWLRATIFAIMILLFEDQKT